MPKIVGIDLGTTNSVIAVMEGSEPTVIPMSDGGRLCPSVVGFNRTGERLVGALAKRQAVSNPDRTVSSIKRQMGKDHTVSIDGKDYTPQEISAMVLQKLRADAEAFLATPVEQAVITVPAYFSDAQRQATKDAGTIAGLDVVRIINEPTAAALAYGMDREEFHTLLVWDLGGGTFDVSILELDAGVFDVRSTSGDTMLGGDDWDQRIVDWLVERFREENEIDLRRDRLAMQRLKEAAEKAKIELSAVVTTTINLPFLSTTTAGPLHLDVNLSRAQFEALTSDLLERLISPTKRALEDAGIGPDGVDRVLLVGGSTRMPAVQALVERMFGKEPFKGVNPDEVVALGAAVQGAVLAGDVKDVVLLDVTPLSLGIETLGGVMTRLIERNTTIPTSKTEMFTTASDGQTAVDVKVYQGEREIASYNKHLANFQLTGLRPAKRGETKIAVTFDIDVNGIVHVSARDTATEREQSVVITSATGLSKDEIDRMVREAQQHAAEDRSRRELQDERNRAEAVLAAAERSLSEASRSLDPNAAERVEEAMRELRSAVAAADRDSIRSATERLAYALHDFDSNQRGAAPSQAAASFVREFVDEMNRGYAREDDVLDGEFTKNTPAR